MGAIEQEVAAIVKDKFKSIAEFARITNVSYSTLHSLFEKGSFARAQHSTVAAIARGLEVDAASLAQGRIEFNSARFRGFVEVPLFGSIPAGSPIEPEETDDRFPIHKELAERYPKSFLLRVSGTSMNRVLPDGCYALIEPCSNIDFPGQPYAVFVGGNAATVKRVRLLGNGLELAPDSTDPTWPIKVFDYGKNDAEEVSIIGRVVWYCLPFNWRFD